MLKKAIRAARRSTALWTPSEITLTLPIMMPTASLRATRTLLERMDRPAALVLVENIMPQGSCPFTLGRWVILYSMLARVSWWN
jgi:hypothetical protein